MIKFLDLFSGIGGFRLGLERAGFDPVGFVEIDKFARQSYQAMYDTAGEWTAEDITKVTDDEWRSLNGKVDIITGGFPCQSFSIAGKRLGFLDKTKGTLFFEIARAIEQIQPSIIFLENVKGLLNHDKGNTFRVILNTLDELGYDVEWRVLNSKDFGVPQNRERVYIIGHSRRDGRRKILPIFRENGETNNATIRDLTNKDFSRHGKPGNVLATDGLSGALTYRDFKEPKQILVNSTLAIPVVTPDRMNKRQNGRRFKENGDPSYTLTAQDRHGVVVNDLEREREREREMMVKENTKKGYDVAKVGDSINLSNPNSKTRRGRVGHKVAQTLVTSSEQATIVQVPRGFNKGGEHKIAPTVSSNSYQENNLVNYDLRIRKLTPKECWRLQGFPDELFEKAKADGISDSQLYKQAGNAVTVNVIEYIGGLLKEKLEG